MTAFSRRQLVDRDYNPLEDPEGPDRADLERRYRTGERPIPLDHAAAVRGILVSEGKNVWKWIWDWGLLHDEIVRKYGYDRLYARYRNQFTFLPTIEFEGPAVAEPLRMLLRDPSISRTIISRLLDGPASGRSPFGTPFNCWVSH